MTKKAFLKRQMCYIVCIKDLLFKDYLFKISTSAIKSQIKVVEAHMAGLKSFFNAAAIGNSDGLIREVGGLNQDNLELIRKASAQMQAGINYRKPEVAQDNKQNVGPKLG